MKVLKTGIVEQRKIGDSGITRADIGKAAKIDLVNNEFDLAVTDDPIRFVIFDVSDSSDQKSTHKEDMVICVGAGSVIEAAHAGAFATGDAYPLIAVGTDALSAKIGVGAGEKCDVLKVDNTNNKVTFIIP